MMKIKCIIIGIYFAQVYILSIKPQEVVLSHGLHGFLRSECLHGFFRSDRFVWCDGLYSVHSPYFLLIIIPDIFLLSTGTYTIFQATGFSGMTQNVILGAVRNVQIVFASN